MRARPSLHGRDFPGRIDGGARRAQHHRRHHGAESVVAARPDAGRTPRARHRHRLSARAACLPAGLGAYRASHQGRSDRGLDPLARRFNAGLAPAGTRTGRCHLFGAGTHSIRACGNHDGTGKREVRADAGRNQPDGGGVAAGAAAGDEPAPGPNTTSMRTTMSGFILKAPSIFESRVTP